MKQEIIDRFNFKTTNECWGQSFLFGFIIYLWPNAIRGWTIYISHCDPTGFPMPDGYYCMYVLKKEEEIIDEVHYKTGVIVIIPESFLMDEVVLKDYLVVIIEQIL